MSASYARAHAAAPGGDGAASRTVPPLCEVLENRRWIRWKEPFAHITADHVFQADFYKRLSASYDGLLAPGLSETAAYGRVSRVMKGYDAYGLNFSQDLMGPLSLFISGAWHDMVAEVMGINATGDVNCGLHHHVTGSKNGRVHNDLNPAWFANYDSVDGIRVARHELCCYKTGAILTPGVKVHEVVRAVAIIYYLNNPPWNSGDGGETGLYSTADDPIDHPAKAVPPVNNSMLMFECTPFSFHTFISNKCSPRNTVIMWLHRPKQEVVQRWGEGSIVQWPNG